VKRPNDGQPAGCIRGPERKVRASRLDPEPQSPGNNSGLQWLHSEYQFSFVFCESWYVIDEKAHTSFVFKNHLLFVFNNIPALFCLWKS
jgi:hypothetical protein